MLSSETGALAQASDPSDASDPLAKLHWIDGPPVFVARRDARPSAASDGLILKFYFWSVKHDRPMSWAIYPLHWTRLFRPRSCPSVSQLHRRIASVRLAMLQHRVQRQLAGEHDGGDLFIDGRTLPVSPVRQDKDARSGHVPGGMGRGYKLHAIVDDRSRIVDFSVLPLNRHEMPVAREMIARLPPLSRGSFVFADGNYDAHTLHKDIDARGWPTCERQKLTRPTGCLSHEC